MADLEIKIVEDVNGMIVVDKIRTERFQINRADVEAKKARIEVIEQNIANAQNEKAMLLSEIEEVSAIIAKADEIANAESQTENVVTEEATQEEIVQEEAPQEIAVDELGNPIAQ